MSAMKEYLIDQIDKLSKETGYSDEFLMDAWLDGPKNMSWPDFVDATLDRQLIEAPADVLWMITVSPCCKTPMVRCVEMAGPQPFTASITTKDFATLPKLMTDALKQIDKLRRGVECLDAGGISALRRQEGGNHNGSHSQG